MTEPRTDSFEEWYEKKIVDMECNGFLTKEDKEDLLDEDSIEKCYAEDGWNAGQKDAEKKIETLTKALEYIGAKSNASAADHIVCLNIIYTFKHTANKALAEIKEVK